MVLVNVLCLLYSLPGPPSISIQNGTYQLYPINRRLCPGIDPFRDTIFELYTRQNVYEPQILLINDKTSVKFSNIDFNRPTIIFFHGYLESSSSDDAIQIKENYLNLGDYNVILVNTERLLAGPFYLTAAENVQSIAEYSAKFIDFLVYTGLHLSRLHIVGMSLGAQIAGITGKHMRTGKASRITGLDPAGPVFNNKPPEQRIGQDDAEFVDIIHTNAGEFGTIHASGHVDVWVNGGSKQPGCSPWETMQRVPGSLAELTFCNHYQAYRLYVMSLKNPSMYRITQCNSYLKYQSGHCNSKNNTFLGLNVDTSSSGNYYIDTAVTAVYI